MDAPVLAAGHAERLRKLGVTALYLFGSRARGEEGPTSDYDYAVLTREGGHRKGGPGALKSSAALRAERRLFDGAPPVIPHPPLGASCTECHDERGMDVPGLGFAPPSPHERTPGMSALSRCNQCHVHALAADEFVASTFVGLAQDLRRGERLHPGAPPVMPHARAMRENCSACHDGPAAREELRCSHPECARCEQCHVPQLELGAFTRLRAQPRLRAQASAAAARAPCAIGASLAGP